MNYELYSMHFNNDLKKKESDYIENILVDFIEHYQDYKSYMYAHNFLLNIDDIKNNKEINIIEKFVYDNAIDIIDKYNSNNVTDYSIDDFYIEFWGNKNDNFRGYHFDVDEMSYDLGINPNPCLFSSVTYLCDNNIAPLVVTNIKRPAYIEEYEAWENNIIIDNHSIKDMLLLFPRKYTQMIFNGHDYYHGTLQLEKKTFNKRYILGTSFYLKKHRPMCLPYFSYFSYYIWLYNKTNSNKIGLYGNSKYLLPVIKFSNQFNNIQIVHNRRLISNEKKINVLMDENDHLKFFTELLYNSNEMTFNFIKREIYSQICIYDCFIFKILFVANEENS